MINMLVIGALLYGSIYTTGVLAVGLLWDNHGAVIWALMTAGTAYLSYFLQIIEFLSPASVSKARRIASVAAVLASIAAGVVAGVLLLV